ncbi:conserved hypothetical protein [Anaeromyxobacter dehalogenans 2CP-1]|uniref:DUF3037 domain-containing protein n=1 Tax=Anaeromyxobacter dehalogenans (strain ATCC BAA-258 / DSM 21875 / 2CP-1) TaxID=455488 RepID=B8J6F5_ANAD2|nr:DUF3037 domain-containing protein [Anaeromyxobacter dehalogenans]ACL65136.1 conserved hypothetical protein [Anaeromyxobacter dehalogenans 2CP-1]
MPARSSFDYAVVRVVPRVEREEFVNAGVVLFCLERGFLGARVELDRARVTALCPHADLDAIAAHLEAIPRICAGGQGAGPIGALSVRERFHWLTAPRSTMVQLSPVHSGLCDDPDRALERLFQRLVRPPAPPQDPR